MESVLLPLVPCAVQGTIATASWFQRKRNDWKAEQRVAKVAVMLEFLLQKDLGLKGYSVHAFLLHGLSSVEAAAIHQHYQDQPGVLKQIVEASLKAAQVQQAMMMEFRADRSDRVADCIGVYPTCSIGHLEQAMAHGTEMSLAEAVGQYWDMAFGFARAVVEKWGCGQVTWGEMEGSLSEDSQWLLTTMVSPWDEAVIQAWENTMDKQLDETLTLSRILEWAQAGPRTDLQALLVPPSNSTQESSSGMLTSLLGRVRNVFYSQQEEPVEDCPCVVYQAAACAIKSAMLLALLADKHSARGFESTHTSVPEWWDCWPMMDPDGFLLPEVAWPAEAQCWFRALLTHKLAVELTVYYENAVVNITQQAETWAREMKEHRLQGTFDNLCLKHDGIDRKTCAKVDVSAFKVKTLIKDHLHGKMYCGDAAAAVLHQKSKVAPLSTSSTAANGSHDDLSMWRANRLVWEAVKATAPAKTKAKGEVEMASLQALLLEQLCGVPDLGRNKAVDLLNMREDKLFKSQVATAYSSCITSTIFFYPQKEVWERLADLENAPHQPLGAGYNGQLARRLATLLHCIQPPSSVEPTIYELLKNAASESELFTTETYDKVCCCLASCEAPVMRLSALIDVVNTYLPNNGPVVSEDVLVLRAAVCRELMHDRLKHGSERAVDSPADEDHPGRLGYVESVYIQRGLNVVMPNSLLLFDHFTPLAGAQVGQTGTPGKWWVMLSDLSEPTTIRLSVPAKRLRGGEQDWDEVFCSPEALQCRVSSVETPGQAERGTAFLKRRLDVGATADKDNDI